MGPCNAARAPAAWPGPCSFREATTLDVLGSLPALSDPVFALLLLPGHRGFPQRWEQLQAPCQHPAETCWPTWHAVAQHPRWPCPHHHSPTMVTMGKLKHVSLFTWDSSLLSTFTCSSSRHVPLCCVCMCARTYACLTANVCTCVCLCPRVHLCVHVCVLGSLCSMCTHVSVLRELLVCVSACVHVDLCL